MARELGDVLHYFIPEARPASREPARAPSPSVLVPLGEGDVLRAAFVWNLAVEAARFGVSASVVASRASGSAPLWPAPGAGSVGAQMVLCNADDPREFHDAWKEIAAQRAGERSGPSLVIACVPGSWLVDPRALLPLLDWVLLFVTPEARELQLAYRYTEALSRAAPQARVGVTVHGVRSVADARATFLTLAAAVEKQIGRPLESYGVLLDDLHVYRAIVNLRPIGLVQPQSRAARALRDVARLLLDDCRGAEAR